MARVLIAYYSRGGHTKSMAEAVARGVKNRSVECDLKSVAEVDLDILKGYDGIILGSPTYYGHPAAELKALLDASVKYHKQLAGKVGGAFASCGVLGGGGETTVRALLDALLIHGMIIQGHPSGAHYGPVSVGAPDDEALQACALLGERVADLVSRLH